MLFRSLNGKSYSVFANAVYQYVLPNGVMILNGKLGAGMFVMSDITFDYSNGKSSEPVGNSNIALNLGASFQWFFWKNLFAEAGAEFTHLFSPASPAPGMLRGSIGLGLRF